MGSKLRIRYRKVKKDSGQMSESRGFVTPDKKSKNTQAVFSAEQMEQSRQRSDSVHDMTSSPIICGKSSTASVITDSLEENTASKTVEGKEKEKEEEKGDDDDDDTPITSSDAVTITLTPATPITSREDSITNNLSTCSTNKQKPPRQQQEREQNDMYLKVPVPLTPAQRFEERCAAMRRSEWARRLFVRSRRGRGCGE